MIGGYPRTRAIRDERRARAEEVQAKSAGLTPKQRLEKLDSKGYTAKKERAKLTKLLNK